MEQPNQKQISDKDRNAFAFSTLDLHFWRKPSSSNAEGKHVQVHHITSSPRNGRKERPEPATKAYHEGLSIDRNGDVVGRFHTKRKAEVTARKSASTKTATTNNNIERPTTSNANLSVLRQQDSDEVEERHDHHFIRARTKSQDLRNTTVFRDATAQNAQTFATVASENRAGGGKSATISRQNTQSGTSAVFGNNTVRASATFAQPQTLDARSRSLPRNRAAQPQPQKVTTQIYEVPGNFTTTIRSRVEYRYRSDEYEEDQSEAEKRRNLQQWMHEQPISMRRLDQSDRQVAMLSDERDNIQKKTFTKWVNKHLTKTGSKVEDLFKDLQDGFKLISLLEVLTGERLLRENGYTRFHRIQNVQYCLDFLKKKNIKLVNIRPDDIVEGNAKLTLGLIWTIILHFQVSVIKRHQQEELLRLNNTSADASKVFTNAYLTAFVLVFSFR